jgi:C4-dicarboxylate transporter DctM subunit
MAIGVAFALMGVFFMAGLYVAGALGLLSLVMLKVFGTGAVWNILGNKAWETNTQLFILVAIPLFLLMGELMMRSGIGDRMYTAVSRWVGFLPGGLIHTNIASCAVFAACSGSSVATSATISRVSLPFFRQRNYNERLVIGSLAAGGTLGILIPPSIGFIVYGLLVEESIGRLYLAGFIPGIMLAGAMMLMIIAAAKVWPSIAPSEEVETWTRRFMGLVGMIPVFGIIFVVLGGIYMGWATPTEAAAFGVTGALILAVINNSSAVWRPLGLAAASIPIVAMILPRTVRVRLWEAQQASPLLLSDFKAALASNTEMIKDSVLSITRTSAMIMLIVMAALTLSFAFARLGISHEISSWITGLNLGPVQLVLLLVIFYLLLGTFMESFAMLVTTVPILAPALRDTGVDLVWFGVIMVILIEAALISPPEGINLYVLHGVRRDVQAEIAGASGLQEQVGTIADVYIGVLPFMACMALVIGLIIAFPSIALHLPGIVKDCDLTGWAKFLAVFKGC